MGMRKKEILEINKVPRAEFLIPESYDAEPDCAPAGSISGFIFINFVLSAASVAANLVNNANSNNNNNNNNNNDNNDNVDNINIANNNNAGNNVNDIQICPFPCLPQPPPVIVPGQGRRRRSDKRIIVGSLTNNFLKLNRAQVRSDQDDIMVATLIFTELFQELDSEQETGF